MEKVCEFCMALRPAVYCQADSALLCLSCDLKVHSANALSNRHPRSPLCDSCQACPASVRCDDHGMHMCRTCDRSLHRSSSTSSHKNRAIGSYTGCPSAKDLAALWDLDLGELGDASGSSLIVSSQEFVDFGNQGLDAMSCTKSVRGRMPDEGMNNQQPNKISHKGQQQQQQQQQSRSSLVIVQQILDLQRLQLNEWNCYSSTMRCEEKRDTSSSSGKALRRIYEAGHENSQHSRDLEAEFLKGVTPLEELGSEGFSSPFSSLENLSTLTAGISLLGDSFWQCRSPLQTGQFMSQNVQDLGLFEDLSCRDDFNNIPDVDVTFKSFEELFGGNQDPATGLLTSDNDLSCSSVDREISFDKSENSRAPDASASSSTYLDSITRLNSGTSCLNRFGCPLQPSYSEMSFSISQVTEGASGSPDFGAAAPETKPNVLTRYRNKKKARLDGEKIRQELSKDGINVRKRVKSRQSDKSGRNPDDMSTRSF